MHRGNHDQRNGNQQQRCANPDQRTTEYNRTTMAAMQNRAAFAPLATIGHEARYPP